MAEPSAITTARSLLHPRQAAGPALVAVAGPDGALLAASQAVCELLSLNRDDLLDQTALSQPAALLHSLFKSEGPRGDALAWPVERSVVAQDGRTVRLRGEICAAQFADGRAIGVGLFADDTAVHQAAALGRRLRLARRGLKERPLLASETIVAVRSDTSLAELGAAVAEPLAAPGFLHGGHVPLSLRAQWHAVAQATLHDRQTRTIDYTVGTAADLAWYRLTVALAVSPGLIVTLQETTEQHVLDEAIAAAQAELQQLQSVSATSLFVLDRDYMIVAANQEAARQTQALLGRPLVIGSSMLDYSAEDEVVSLTAHVDAAFAGRPFQTEHQYLSPAGELWFHFSYTPIFERSGAVAFVCFAATNVTQRRVNVRDLERREARYRSLVENGADIVIVFDRGSRVRFVTPSVEPVLGYPPEAVVGASPYDVVHPDDLASVRRSVAACVARPRGMATMELRARHASGQWHTLEVVALNLLADPSIDGVVFNARDVTSRKRAEASQRLLIDASATLAQSLQTADTLATVVRLALPLLGDWTILSLGHPAAADASALVAATSTATEPVLRAWWTRCAPAASPPPLVQAAAGRTATTLRAHTLADARALLGDHGEGGERLDAVVPRYALIMPLQVHGRWFGAWTFARTQAAVPLDAAERALAEDLVRRVALALDHERLYHEAQAMVRLREEFVSIASHELRTPLTTVKGYAQFLAQQVRQSEWDRTRIGWLSQQLLGQVNRLEVLVGDLLDASRLQQGRLELRPEAADLADLARAALTHFAVSPDHSELHTFTLDAPEPVPGRWDPARLDQVLSNLISNAVKYSPRGGEVRVQVRQLDGQAELRVQDQGIGIPLNEQAGLFRPFARSETVRRSVNGVGLGLYITAQIVARHHGTIRVESIPDRGSTFIVCLPLHADATVVALGSGARLSEERDG